MIINQLVPLLIVLPLIAAALCVVLSHGKLAWICTVFMTGLITLLAGYLTYYVSHAEPIYYAMGGWAVPLGIEYKMDLANGVILTLVSSMGFMASLYGGKIVNADIVPSKQPAFYGIFLLALSGLLGVVITNDAFNIYVFLEISSLAIYTLIAMGNDRRALFASFEYLILGTIGAAFILIAIGLLYIMTGTLNMSDIALRIQPLLHTLPIKAALAFFVIGLLLKIAVFPLHIWLTNAYSYAPSMVSVFLSATATKVGIYLLAKICFTLFGTNFVFHQLPGQMIFLILAAAGMIVGGVMAILQDNIKRMLAYSSVSQIGYMILGISLASSAGLSAAYFYMISHAVMKAGLFMIAGMVAYYVGGNKLQDFAGLGKKMPFVMGCLVICGAGLIGIPGTSGFVGKWYLLQALWQQGLWPVLIIILASSLLALIYMGKLIEVIYFGTYRGPKIMQMTICPWMLISILLLTLLVLFWGIYPASLMKVTDQMAYDVLYSFPNVF